MKTIKFFSRNGMNPRYFQEDFINNKFDNIYSKGKILLAASPGAGKTLTSIACIEQFLSDHPESRVLVLTHNQVILREQYFNTVENHKVSFTYSQDIKSDAQVVVTIPSSITRNEDIPKFDFIIVDEAHQFYETKKGGGMVQRIINESKAKYELLLTGSPSKFNGRGIYTFPITICDLVDNEICSDVLIEVATANYSASHTDYNQNQELKSKHTDKITTNDVNKTMHSVFESIHRRLNSMHRLNPERYSYINRNAGWIPALGELKKTMIACSSKKEANKVYKYFKSKTDNVAISHSSISDGMQQLENFINNPDVLILIVVGRGVLGFNMPELENVIDMTGSQNLDRITQLLCRVNRIHPDGGHIKKLFIKVAPINQVDYTHAVMHGVLCMFDKEWFLKFNGKNFVDMPAPVKTNKRKKSDGEKRNKSTKKTKIVKFEGLPSVEFFKTLQHKRDDALSGVEYTTIADVRTELLGLKIKPSGYWTLDKCKEIALNYKTKIDWHKNDYPSYKQAHRNGWMDDCAEHMDSKYKPQGYWTLSKCKAIALKYDNPKDWREGHPASYSASMKKAWYKECKKHMKNTINRSYTLKECKAVSKKYTNKKDFRELDNKVYNIAYLKGWLDECCEHMTEIKKPNGYWTLKKCLDIASKYKRKVDWRKNESASYSAAYSKGWLDECCEHMDLKTPLGYWTFDRCKEEALKYKTIKEWREKSSSSYHKSLRKGWYKECKKHMKETRKPNGYWTLERCKEDAANYTKKTDWLNKNSSAYAIAGRKGWIDECCAHM